MQWGDQQTTADVLQNTGNVFVQRSQMGGGSPVLRGFEANKVLLVVDGVKMNNAIYRGGHLQNAITVDYNLLDRMEIVFGPGSVVYGSDALGGVMHLYTKKPIFSGDKKITASAAPYIRYGSANTEKTIHTDINIGLRKVAFLSGFTFSDFDDLRQGADRSDLYSDFGKRNFYVQRINGQDSIFLNPHPDIQRGTGYRQLDLIQKILFKPGPEFSHSLNVQYSVSSDIPRYDRLAEVNKTPKFSEWYYGPQKRLLSAYTLQQEAKTLISDKMSMTFAYQNIEESRNDRRFRQNSLNSRKEKVSVYSANIDLSKQLRKHEFRYGAEGILNYVKSSAEKTNIVTGEIQKLDTRYPDGGSNMHSAALFYTHSIPISGKWIFTDGLRFSYVNLHARFNDKTFFPFPFESVVQKNKAVNGSLGMVFLPGNNWKIYSSLSSGFRAPNVDDLSKVFESVPGNVIVPNPELKPEYTYTGELSVAKSSADKFHSELTGYYTIYSNAITTEFAQFDGRDSIEFDGAISRVQKNVNTGKAYIYGFNAAGTFEFTDWLLFNNTFNYTFGRKLTAEGQTPLDHIPPVFGKSSLIFKIQRFNGELFMLYNGWKKLKNYNITGEDNISQATPDGMPSWYTFNLRTSYHINENLKLQASLENILDRNYRIFSSGISAPGRNLIISLRGSF